MSNDAAIKRIHRFATEVERLPATAVTAAAKAAVVAHERAVAGVTGGDRILGGMKSARPAALSASVKIVKRKGLVDALISPKPAGQWGILEKGAKAHLVGSKSRGSRKRLQVAVLAADTAVLSNEDTGFLFSAKSGFAAMGPVSHPGAPKRPSWEAGKRLGKKAGDKAMRVAQVAAVKKALR